MFTGKVAVVTGAGSGIGRALARELAGQGCLLALSDVNQAALDETVAQLSPAPAAIDARLLDVADRGALQAYATAVAGRFGHVDIVINNAGVAVAGNALEVSDADFEWLMGVNFWGVVNGSRAFLPQLATRPRAWLVNISSIFGIIGVPGQTAYNASKFAVRGYTEALWHEYQASNVTICLVHPGGIKTAIARNSRVSSGVDAAEHAQGVNRFEQLARTSPEQAAAVIVDGMERGSRRIYIGNDARVIAVLARMFPDNYMRILGRLFSSMRE
jgi:short-subunit dehydrogenase